MAPKGKRAAAQAPPVTKRIKGKAPPAPESPPEAPEAPGSSPGAASDDDVADLRNLPRPSPPKTAPEPSDGPPSSGRRVRGKVAPALPQPTASSTAASSAQAERQSPSVPSCMAFVSSSPPASAASTASAAASRSPAVVVSDVQQQSLQEALTAATGAMAASSQQMAEHFRAVGVQLTVVDVAITAADEAVLSGGEVVARRERELEESQARAGEGEAQLQRRLSEREAAQSSLDALRQETAECEGLVNFELQLIVDGATTFKNGVFERANDPKHIKALEPLLGKTDLAPSVFQALPAAAAKLPAQRDAAASGVVSETIRAVKAYLAALAEKTAAAQEQLTEREATVEMARDSLAALARDVAAARRAVAAAVAESHAAVRHKRDVERQFSRALEATVDLDTAVEAARKQLQDFEQGALDVFRKRRQAAAADA